MRQVYVARVTCLAWLITLVTASQWYNHYIVLSDFYMKYIHDLSSDSRTYVILTYFYAGKSIIYSWPPTHFITIYEFNNQILSQFIERWFKNGDHIMSKLGKCHRGLDLIACAKLWRVCIMGKNIISKKIFSNTYFCKLGLWWHMGVDIHIIVW